MKNLKPVYEKQSFFHEPNHDFHLKTQDDALFEFPFFESKSFPNNQASIWFIRI